MTKNLKQKITSGIGACFFGLTSLVNSVGAEMTDEEVIAQSRVVLNNCEKDLGCYKDKVQKMGEVLKHYDNRISQIENNFKENIDAREDSNLVGKYGDYLVARDIAKDLYQIVLNNYNSALDSKASLNNFDGAEAIANETRRIFGETVRDLNGIEADYNNSWPEWPKFNEK